MSDRRRLRTCVENWPECFTMGYDPRCCRFPKSCSCTVYDEQHVTEADLEPAPPVVPDQSGGQRAADNRQRAAEIADDALAGPLDELVAERDAHEAEVAMLRTNLEYAQADVEHLVRERRNAEAERDALRAALADAYEGLQEMLPYCSDYFREKWDLDDYVTRARAALGGDV